MQIILGISRVRAHTSRKTDPSKWAIESIDLIEFDKTQVQVAPFRS
jgi:hypothetical protein